MKDATITVRVPRRLKEELARYGVNVSEVVRKSLEEEVRRRKREELRAVAMELGKFFSKISDEEIVRSIRETRDSR